MSEAQYQAKVVEVSPNSEHRVLLKNSIEQTCKSSLQPRITDDLSRPARVDG